MTESERIKEALVAAGLLRDQLVDEMKKARLTIETGEKYLEQLEWNVADLKAKYRRAKDD